ncbi:MAG: hypothetical protein OXH79_16010 [Boseongicola sp.]|nr:hypothetical protein [Boseongicola sp.]
MIIPGSQRIRLATRPLDIRRGHDAIAATAALELGVDINSGVLAVLLHDVRVEMHTNFLENRIRPLKSDQE